MFTTKEKYPSKNEQTSLQMNNHIMQRNSTQRVNNNISGISKINSFLTLNEQDNENQYKIGQKQQQQQYNKQSYISSVVEARQDMNQIKKRSNLGEIGKLLMQNPDINRFDRKPLQPNQIASAYTNNISNQRNERSSSNRSQHTNHQQSFQEDSLDTRAAGLTVLEIEKLRDQKHNFAADYHRKQLVMENERGGLFDRVENSGVKTMFIPNANNIQDEFYKNKQKHQSHVINFGEDERNTSLPNQATQADILSILNIENLPDDDKRQIINQKLQYLQPQTASFSAYEMSLKRRHAAKKLLQKRQTKLKALVSMVNEYY